MPASSGVIFLKSDKHEKLCRSFQHHELIEISAKAGEYFLKAELPLGDGSDLQSADDYMETLSSTSDYPT